MQTLPATCMKYMLFSLNFFIWIFGLALLILGIFFRIDSTIWQSQDKLNLSGFSVSFYIVIAVGCILLIMGFLGCFGALREIRFMLIAYFVIVLIILILEIVAIALVWKLGTGRKLQDFLTKHFKEQIVKAGETDEFTFVDFIQIQLQCCGAEGPEDYAEEKPASCANEATGSVNPKGCGQELRRFLELRAGIIGGICIGLILLKVAALAMAACLIKAFGDGGKPCIECAADDVQLSFVTGHDYEKKQEAYVEDETLDIRKKKKEEKKLAKEEKAREAKELKKAEKKRKEEEKKQKRNKDQKEAENTDMRKDVPPPHIDPVPVDPEEIQTTENNVTPKLDQKEKEKQAEQKKLAEEAQKTLEEKRKKKEGDTESAGSTELKLETQIV